MVPNILDRFLGRTATVRDTVTVSITSLTTTAYSAGDVVNNGTTLQLACIPISTGEGVRLTGLSVYENAVTGTRAKAALRIYILDQDYAPPAQNTPLVLPSSYTAVKGVFDVAAGDYVETSDGTNFYATAHVDPAAASVSGGTLLKVAAGTRHLYAVVATTATPTFATSAALTFEFTFEQ